MDGDAARARTVPQSQLGMSLASRPPRIRPDCLIRERLLRQLDESIEGALTLVTAPAGFGKSTLLGQWAAGAPMPVAWVRIREHRADTLTFLGAITAAVQSLFPGTPTLPDSGRLLGGRVSAPERYLVSTLFRELCEAPQEFILIIDDFHLVSEQVILDFALDLVYEAADTVHLVLSSRADPSLPIERLRASGHVTEIRASALQFTFEEVAAYLTTQLGARTSRAVAGEAMAHTEGWITGLRLAILSSQVNPRPEQFLARLRAYGGQHVMGYLVSEVLAQQPRDVQNFLLRTSVLEQLTADLCDAVVGSTVSTTPAREILDEIERRNLFVTRIDDSGNWSRYHALFQQFLQHELVARCGSEELVALHRKASGWFARHGMIDEALRHTLEIADYEAASRLIEGTIEKALNDERWRDLERWLKLLPDKVIQDHPALLIAQAVIHSVQFRLPAIPPLLLRAAELLRAHSDADAAIPREILRGISDVLWSQNLFYKGEIAKGARLASRAIAALPPTSTYARGSAIMWSALFKHVAGEGDAAVQRLERLIDTDESPSVIARALLALCVISRQAGRLQKCHAAAERLLTYAQRHHLLLDVNWAHYFLGWVAYERNRLDEARDHLLMVSEQRFVANATCVTDSLSILALTYHAQGRATEAEETLQDLNQYAVELNHAAAQTAVGALRARLAIARDDPDAARAMLPWLNSPSAPPTPMLWMLPPSLTQAHILVAIRDEEGRSGAVERLVALEQFTQSTHDRWKLHMIRSLQALAYVQVGRRTKAIALALEALTAAQPERFVRTFADCGPEFATLLQAVRRQSLPSSTARYIDEILNACSSPRRVSAPDAPAWQDLSGAQAHLISPLTEREIEVLFMLDQRYSDKEIAQALVISTFTVQTHTRSIYRKLEVGDRREAAMKARSLGFISHTSSTAMQQP